MTKLYSLILSLPAITLSCGCDSGDVPSVANPEMPRQISPSDDSQPSASDESGDSTERTISDSEIVQADVRTIIDAAYKGDIETVLKFSHPKIVEMLGGRTEAKKTTEDALSKVVAMGMALESLVFPDQPTFLKTDQNHFAIIPTKSVITANGQRIESLNYQFGIRAVGTSKWTYIEGSRINKENVKALFPDFPSGYEFPNFYRKKL